MRIESLPYGGCGWLPRYAQATHASGAELGPAKSVHRRGGGLHAGRAPASRVSLLRLLLKRLLEVLERSIYGEDADLDKEVLDNGARPGAAAPAPPTWMRKTTKSTGL